MSSNADHNAWLLKGCRKCLPAREALLTFRALGYPRCRETETAEKRLSRRVVDAIQKCISGGSECTRPGRGGRRNIFDVSKERVLRKGPKAVIPRWQLTPAGVYNMITSPAWSHIVFTDLLSVFSSAQDSDTVNETTSRREIEDPGSWSQLTALIGDEEMFRFGSLPAYIDSVSSAVDLGLMIFKGLIPPTFQPIDGGASEVFFGKGYSGTHTDARHGILKVLYGKKIVKVSAGRGRSMLAAVLPEVKPGLEGTALAATYCPFASGSKLWVTHVLLPGDSLFIPQGMWHNVHSPVRWTVGMAIDIERT